MLQEHSSQQYQRVLWPSIRVRGWVGCDALRGRYQRFPLRFHGSEDHWACPHPDPQPRSQRHHRHIPIRLELLKALGHLSYGLRSRCYWHHDRQCREVHLVHQVSGRFSAVCRWRPDCGQWRNPHSQTGLCGLACNQATSTVILLIDTLEPL
jgi:hypothetical protein